MLDNPADILTTYVTAEAFNKHLYNARLSSPHVNWHTDRGSFTNKQFHKHAYKHMYRSTNNSSMRVRYIHPCWRHGFAIPCIDNDNVTFIILDFWQSVKLLDWWQCECTVYDFLLHGVFNNGWINNSEWNNLLLHGIRNFACRRTVVRTDNLAKVKQFFSFRLKLFSRNNLGPQHAWREQYFLVEEQEDNNRDGKSRLQELVNLPNGSTISGRTSQQSNMSIKEFLSRCSSPRTTIWLGAQLSTLQRIGDTRPSRKPNGTMRSTKARSTGSVWRQWTSTTYFSISTMAEMTICLEQRKTNEWGVHNEVNNEFSWKWQPLQSLHNKLTLKWRFDKTTMKAGTMHDFACTDFYHRHTSVWTQLCLGNFSSQWPWQCMNFCTVYFR